MIDELDTKLLKKVKKSPYTTDKQLLNLINLLESNIKKINDDKVPIRLDDVEKREIDLGFIASMVLFSSCTLTSPI